jgi:hypothetical protein
VCLITEALFYEDIRDWRYSPAVPDLGIRDEE